MYIYSHGSYGFFKQKNVSLGNFEDRTPNKLTTLPETNIAPENGWLEY